MRNLTVIPTEYRGVKMRSRGEARFAKWCDDRSVKWMYEPEGLTINGKFYLPDFVLPEIKCVVEIKPLFFMWECYKMFPMINSPELRDWQFLVVTMNPEMTPVAFWDLLCPNQQTNNRSSSSLDFESGEVYLYWCKRCAKPVFAGEMSWACRNCGAYDGNRHLSYDLCVPNPNWKTWDELYPKHPEPTPNPKWALTDDERVTLSKDPTFDAAPF